MIHRIARGKPVIQIRIIAAKVADDAWPLGKLEVLGVRTSKRSSPDTVGRSRRKILFTPWLTMMLSAPNAMDSAIAS